MYFFAFTTGSDLSCGFDVASGRLLVQVGIRPKKRYCKLHWLSPIVTIWLGDAKYFIPCMGIDMARNLSPENSKKIVQCADGCGRTFERQSGCHKYARECVGRRALEAYKANHVCKYKTGKCILCGNETDKTKYCELCKELVRLKSVKKVQEERRVFKLSRIIQDTVTVTVTDTDTDTDTVGCGQVGTNEDCPKRKKNCDCPTPLELKKELTLLNPMKNLGWSPRGVTNIPVYKTGSEYRKYVHERMI